MDLISILSDVIAGLISAILFSVLTYIFGFKIIMNKIDKLKVKTETYKLSTLDIINESYYEKIKEIRNRLEYLNKEIESLKENNHHLKSEEEFWMFTDILNDKEVKRNETYRELDDALNQLLTFYSQLSESKSNK